MQQDPPVKSAYVLIRDSAACTDNDKIGETT